MKLFKWALVALGLAAAAPASAQFADQATFAGNGSGSANTQTVTLPNVFAIADLKGVLVKFIPGATNTGATTLAVSGTAATNVLKPTRSGLAALTGQELTTGQPVGVMYDGTEYVLMTVGPTASPAQFSLESDSLNNLQISVGVNTNALSVALLSATSVGNASAADPVTINFRDPTIQNGGPIARQVTSALSFTVASGSTMGCTSAVVCRLWVVAFDNAGSVALCLYNATNSTSTLGIDESTPQTSQSGTSGGSSVQLFYCSTSAISAKSVRILGYIEVTEATAGTWATTPSKVQLMGAGIKKPGDTVSFVYSASASIAYTPKSAANPIMYEGSGTVTVSTLASSVFNLKRASTNIYGSAVSSGSNTNNTAFAVTGIVFDGPNAGSVASITYSTVFTGGSVTNSSSLLWEIMG